MYFALQNLDAYYGKSKILHGIGLTVEEGELVALMGRNGVGKSTTLRSIIGVVTPARGSVLWQDQELARLKPHRIARLGIGYVPEERAIFPRLSVRENLLMGARAMAGREESAPYWTLERIYRLFPVLEKKQTLRGTFLSGGEQQMLTTARTLMGNPRMLLVDEPTEGLAPLIRKMLIEVLREINQRGVSILLVEQNLQAALALAGRGYVMSKGQIVFSGTSQQIREAEDVRRRYLEV